LLASEETMLDLAQTFLVMSTKEMMALLLATGEAKDKKTKALYTVRDKVNLDHSDGEESDEYRDNSVVVLKTKPRPSSLKGGSIQKYYSSLLGLFLKKMFKVNKNNLILLLKNQKHQHHTGPRKATCTH
jgi:hypothetical protein